MIYTSGTTGRPKAVRRLPVDPANEQAFWALRDRVYGFEDGMIAGMPGPLYHSAPNSFGLRSRRHERIAGADAEIRCGGSAARSIETHRITHMFMVPTMFVRLLKLPEGMREKIRSVVAANIIIHAAAPCPADVKHAMIEWWGPIIHEFYGGTESGPVTLCRQRRSSEEARLGRARGRGLHDPHRR